MEFQETHFLGKAQVWIRPYFLCEWKLSVFVSLKQPRTPKPNYFAMCWTRDKTEKEAETWSRKRNQCGDSQWAWVSTLISLTSLHERPHLIAKLCTQLPARVDWVQNDHLRCFFFFPQGCHCHLLFHGISTVEKQTVTIWWRKGNLMVHDVF